MPLSVWSNGADGGSKGQVYASWVLHVHLAALPLRGRPLLLPLPPPLSKGERAKGENRREEKSCSLTLLCSKLRSYREWYFSHCGFPVTMGSKKAFFKKSFFSQFMAEHPVASSKMKWVSVISPPKRDSSYKGRR